MEIKQKTTVFMRSVMILDRVHYVFDVYDENSKHLISGHYDNPDMLGELHSYIRELIYKAGKVDEPYVVEDLNYQTKRGK